MSGFDREKNKLLEALSSDDLVERIFVWERIIGVLGAPYDDDLIAAAQGMVGFDRPCDLTISLGEWAQMYLDLSGAVPYGGENDDVARFIRDIRNSR